MNSGSSNENQGYHQVNREYSWNQANEKYILITEKNTNLQLLISTNNNYAKNITNNGIDNYPLINWCKQFVSKDKCFVDIGSNIGTYSLYLAPYCQRVYSFEPHRSSYHGLTGGIALNGLTKKIYAYNLALGNEDQHNKRVELYIPSSDGITASLKKDSHNDNIIYDVESPTVYTLDNMGLRNIGFIKINTNGSELDILNGAKKTINDNKPKIILCCLKEKLENIAKLLNTMKYKIISVSGCPNYYLASYDNSDEQN